MEATVIKPEAPSSPDEAARLGEKAAAEMAVDLQQEQRRWNLPLLTWQNSQVISLSSTED